MTNADKFKSIFGLYATELWAKPEKDFLEWLNADAKLLGNSEQLDCSDCVNHGGDWDCDHVQCRKGTDTISRQAILRILNRNLSNGFRDYNGDWWEPTIDADAIDEIKALPTVDAVPVVRCKDCKYWYDAPAADGFNSCEVEIEDCDNG